MQCFVAFVVIDVVFVVVVVDVVIITVAPGSGTRTFPGLQASQNSASGASADLYCSFTPWLLLNWDTILAAMSITFWGTPIHQPLGSEINENTTFRFKHNRKNMNGHRCLAKR